MHLLFHKYKQCLSFLKTKTELAWQAYNLGRLIGPTLPLEGAGISLMLLYGFLEILEQGALCFNFVVGPANYVSDGTKNTYFACWSRHTVDHVWNGFAPNNFGFWNVGHFLTSSAQGREYESINTLFGGSDIF